MIVNVPETWYWWIGLWSVEVDEDPAPSPKFHDQVSGQPAVVVERSVNWKSVFFFLPLFGSNEKSAVGVKQRIDGLGLGVGEGDGVGVGLDDGDVVADADALADAEALALAEADADAEADALADADAEADALAVADGEAEAGAVAGRTAICADAVERRVIDWPPVHIARTGVMSWKCPTTETLTSSPRPSTHGDGLQVIVTSDGEIEIAAPVASVWTAQTTRFTFVSHGWPAWYDDGYREASRAPARAALAMITCDWNRRARSDAARRRSRRTGMMRATSTIA